jgi:beta-mannosidase
MVPLSGSSWRVIAANGTINVPATLPATAHSALRAAGVLQGDPAFRYNEREWAWVAETAWVFQGTFDAPLGVDTASNDTTLVLDGVDTVANISLNGKLLGAVEDAFIHWSFTVPTQLLRGSGNVLNVSFAAPLSASRARARSFRSHEGVTSCKETYADQTCPVPASIYWNDWGEPTERNFVRKPPFDYGWDWGPAFVPVGILGSVRLGSPPPLHNVQLRQEWHPDDGSVTLHVTPSARIAGGDGDGEVEPPVDEPPVDGLEVELCFPACGDDEAERVYATAALAPGDAGPVEAVVHVPVPRLWWPRGYGEQPMYELRASAVPHSGSHAAITKRLGLRKVELVQEPGRPPSAGLPNGTSFYFRVNGLPIFIMGANMIPAGLFEDTVSDAELKWLLEQAAAANMNMLRVCAWHAA